MIQTEISNAFTRKIIGTSLVLFTSAIAFAQEKQNISGTITNSQNQAVPYASLTFTSKTNKLFSDAVLSDDKGNYQINLVPGNYQISIEAIDYKKLIVNKSVSAANKENFKLEPEAGITNSKTKDIEGVVLTAAATKPYKVELDKKTYDVTQDLVSKGGNLQDVLQNVPSVSVETDGTVSMRGNTNVKFLINGKPSALLGIADGTNALQAIPADQIDKIEVISNPSSKFEASGTAGILNIILKKSKKTGFNGSVEGSLGYFPKTSLNTNLSWKKGNWSWFINGGGSYNESRFKNTNDAINFDANRNVTSSSSQYAITKNYNKNYNLNSGFVVDLSENTSLNLSGIIRKNTSDSDGTVDYTDFLANNSVSGTSFRKNLGVGDGYGLQGDLGIDHKFAKKGELISASLSLQKNKSTNNSTVDEFLNQLYNKGNSIDQTTYNKSIIGKVDYELPIGEKSKLEAGYRLDNNTNDYDYKVQEKTSTNPTLVVLNDFTNVTSYQEMINAAYAQFRSKIGKFGYQLGVRDEMTKIDLSYQNLNGGNAVIKKNYNQLFPSIFLSYDLANSNQILLNYSRRIDRPRSFFMIPFMSYNDNRNIFRGNPDMNPSYINSFELGYALQKKKITINPTLYYRYTQDDDKITVTRNIPTDRILDLNNATDLQTYNTFQTRPINLGSEQRYGLDLNANADLNSWWKITLGADLYGYKTDGIYQYSYTIKDVDNVVKTKNESLDFSGSGFSSRIRLANTIKLDKNTSFQIQGMFRGAEKTASQSVKAMYVANFGATKIIWNGNGTISLNIQDIFNTRARQFSSYGANYQRNSYMQFMPRQFSLSLSYRFKQGEKVEQPKKKKDINSNASGGEDQPPM